MCLLDVILEVFISRKNFSTIIALEIVFRVVSFSVSKEGLVEIELYSKVPMVYKKAKKVILPKHILTVCEG